MGSFDTEIGSVVSGLYEITSCLGQGGMGVVYKAYDRRNDRIVAIKLINRERLNDPNHILRFKREAETTARLNHPAITRVHDFGVTDEGQPYLVMDFAEGRTLSSLIAEEGQLSLAETLPIFAVVCDGLEHAHENKVLHRDIKPSNIMINREERTTSVKILDFGIAKILESAATPSLHITHTGELLGSPFYMSPEQAKGGRIDHRSDLYSLGCTLYEALTGGPPHIGESPMSTLLKRESDEPLPMAEASLGRKFPEELEKIVAKLLKHNPDERYQSAGDLKHDLLKVKEQSQSNTGNTKAIIAEKKIGSPLDSQTNWGSKRILLMTATIFLFFAMAASLLLLTWHERGPSVQPAPKPKPAVSQEDQEKQSQVYNTIGIAFTHMQADKLRSAGKFAEAEQLYQQAIADATSAPKPSPLKIAGLQEGLAFTYALGKQYSQSSKEYEKVRACYERFLAPDDPTLIAVYNGLGETYRHQAPAGNRSLLTRAIEMYERAANYYESHLPGNSKLLDAVLTGEGTAFKNLGDKEGEKRTFVKLLKLRTSELGDDRPETLTVLTRLGELCRLQKKFDEALIYDKKWVATYDNSPDTPQRDRIQAVLTLAGDYYNLAAGKNMSMYKESAQLYTRVLKICQQDPAHFQSQIGGANEALGVIYQWLSQFEPVNIQRAERCDLEALRVYARLPNFDRKAIAVTEIRTAGAQLHNGHLNDSIATCLKASKDSVKAYGPNSVAELQGYWVLMQAYNRAGKLREADKVCGRALPLSIRIYSKQDYHTADLLAFWGGNAKQQGNLPKARQLLIDCLSVRRALYGVNHPQTILVQSELDKIDEASKHRSSSDSTEGPSPEWQAQ